MRNNRVGPLIVFVKDQFRIVRIPSSSDTYVLEHQTGTDAMGQPQWATLMTTNCYHNTATDYVRTEGQYVSDLTINYELIIARLTNEIERLQTKVEERDKMMGMPD